MPALEIELDQNTKSGAFNMRLNNISNFDYFAGDPFSDFLKIIDPLPESMSS